MRAFEYENSPAKYLTPEITNAVSAIHEYKGKQELYLEAKPDILNALSELAKVQSTEASNRIEGIGTSSKRLKEIMEERSTPKTRDEEEIAGYRDVLAIIHESYDHIDIKPNIILQFHRDLYSYTLRKVEVMVGQGRTVQESCREIGVNEQTYYRWRNKYGGMSTSEAKKFKALEKENERLKKIVADLSVDNAVLKEVVEGKF